MKHLFTLIFLTVLFGTSSADHRQSSSVLNLQFYGRGDFSVKIDGVNYRWVENGLQIGALAPGNHYIQVIEQFRTQGNPHNQGRNGFVQRNVYNGQIQIPFSSVVWARFTPNYGVRIDRIDPIMVDRRPVPREQCRNLNGDCRDHNHRYDGRQGGGSDWYDDNDRNNNNNDNRGGDGYGGRNQGQRYGNNGYNGHDNFMALQAAIRQASFDSDKLMIANQFISKNTISSKEVADLMGLMTYESNKLELAKNAYEACYDKQNYFLVNQAFTYSNSIRQLNAFIK